ncbi:hypothetical protein NHQ30_011584 [Ciborinia camelliae]|nr:hypothetical protein NHQ30_011584 [Ciborinia camelliae]
MSATHNGDEPDLEAARQPARRADSSVQRKSATEVEPVAANGMKKFLKAQIQKGDCATRLFKYASDQRDVKKEEPWFPDYGILHRLNIADINNQLASCKKEIYEFGSASNDQIIRLRGLLNDQEKGWPPRVTDVRVLAIAIRNYQYIQSQEYQIEQVEMSLKEDVSCYFYDIAKSKYGKNPYDSENYRRLAQPPKLHEHGDPLRHFLCSHLKVWMTYSDEERNTREEDFEQKHPPLAVSPQIEKLARFLIAMFGALAILVPMIIMTLDPSQTKSLITTSVAVVIFACCCSLTLQTANDQTLAATAGYAAVLMVFVGLTG